MVWQSFGKSWWHTYWNPGVENCVTDIWKLVLMKMCRRRQWIRKSVTDIYNFCRSFWYLNVWQQDAGRQRIVLARCSMFNIVHLNRFPRPLFFFIFFIWGFGEALVGRIKERSTSSRHSHSRTVVTQKCEADLCKGWFLVFQFLWQVLWEVDYFSSNQWQPS